jgi:hypothetical protein
MYLLKSTTSQLLIQLIVLLLMFVCLSLSLQFFYFTYKLFGIQLKLHTIKKKEKKLNSRNSFIRIGEVLLFYFFSLYSANWFLNHYYSSWVFEKISKFYLIVIILSILLLFLLIGTSFWRIDLMIFITFIYVFHTNITLFPSQVFFIRKYKSIN